MENSKKGYLVLMMSKTLNTNAMPVALETDDTYGAYLVYKSKAKARKVYGKDVQMSEILIGGDHGKE